MDSFNSHPSPEELLQYSDGIMSNRVEALEDHLDQCDECSLEVILYREYRDFDKLGLLPSTGSLGFKTNPDKSGQQSSSKSGLGKIVGGVVAGLGLTELFAHMPHPALASDSSHGQPTSGDYNPPPPDHNLFPDPVRNALPAASGGSEHVSDSPSHRPHKGGSVTHSGFNEATKGFGMHASGDASSYVHQGYDDTCAIQCQHLILNEFGVDVNEDQLVKEASAKGIYAPGRGTELTDVGKLLESHGIAVHREMDANVFNLATELAEGHKVIVGLDSGELWHENSVLDSIADKLGIGNADHAVIVSGIDTTDPDHVKVIVTDPGTGDVAKQYPLNEFLDAWRTSHFSMVATSEPVPNWHPEMVNFDYHTGHLASVGAAPYEFAHELSGATAHENDPGVLGKLGSLFMSVVNGHVSMDNIASGVGHLLGVDQHFAMPGLVSGLVSLGHQGMLTGAVMALLDPAEAHVEQESIGAHDSGSHSDVSNPENDHWGHHDVGADHHVIDHHDVFHSDSGHDTHHHDDPGDPSDGHNRH